MNAYRASVWLRYPCEGSGMSNIHGGDSRDGQPRKLLGHNSGEEERPKISRATALAQLERLPQEIPQLFSIFTAKQELRAVLQQNTIFSVEPGLKLLDAL